MNSKQKNENSTPRPPVVVVMGHIDHGKTTLLDFIRKTSVVQKEAGGITQHIGAYEFEFPTSAKAESGPRPHSAPGKITFIDTPGHEAFSKMRLRGAKTADIAILVVAADDGVKPQTTEAIKSIEEAKIPFIVAVNKIDKPNADAEKTKKELSKHNVFIEEWGGKIPAVNISAKNGEGVEELLETILLMAELEELRANPNKPASGIVIESHLDPKRGVVATLLILDGTLNQGLFVATDKAMAKVKIFENFLGQALKNASFSSPVLITGFNELPEVGTSFNSFATKEEAAEFIKNAQSPAPTPAHEAEGTSATEQTPEEEKATLPLIIKADALGSLEAIKEKIEQTENENISINIIRTGVGNINEDDIKFASSSKQNPVVIGFNVSYDNKVAEIAERYDIVLKKFEIIYDITDWLKEELEKREASLEREIIIGRAEVLKIFKTEKNRQIIGGKVLTGKIVKGEGVKIIRRGAIISQGKIINLEHNKAKIEEIDEQKEFGALIEISVNIVPGDELEIFSK